MEEFKKALSTPTSQVKKAKLRWKPAEHNRNKLNVDGAFVQNASFGGVGGVLRSATGDFITAFSIPVRHVSSAKHVELLAIRYALE